MKASRNVLGLLLAGLTIWLSGCASQNLFQAQSASVQNRADSLFFGQENTQYRFWKDDKVVSVSGITMTSG